MPPKENATTNGAPQGWAKIETNRPLYKGDRGKGDVVQGWLLGLLTMPPANGKVWRALVIRLTEPCKTCQDRDKNPIHAKVGDEILVPAGHQLLQHLSAAALNPKACAEVRIRPTGMLKVNSGEMTLYEIHANPQLKLRDGHEKLIAMQSQEKTLLPEQTSAVAEADIPF